MLSLLGARASANGVVIDPLACTGYPEARVFLESQSWWSDGGDALGGASEHSHSGACFPYRKTVTGIIRIDVVSHLHNVPGASLVWVRVAAASHDYGVKTLAKISPLSVCASRDCQFITPVLVDTRFLPSDGLTEFRIHTEAQGPSADPWRNLATNGWIARVENGKPDAATPQAVNDPETEGRGWYREPDGTTVRGYENARFLDSLPVAPVSGIWRPRIRTLTGAGGEPIVRSFASIDPSFHTVPEHVGRVVLDQAGAFTGSLEIDTTRLSDGRHKLFLRADANEPTGKLAGALVIPFVVANGGGGAPPPPPPSSPPPPPPPPPAPTAVVVTRPVPGQVVSGTIRLNAAAPGATCVVYLVDGAKVGEDCTPRNGFDEPWNSRSVAKGSHSIVAQANGVSSAAVRFTVKK